MVHLDQLPEKEPNILFQQQMLPIQGLGLPDFLRHATRKGTWWLHLIFLSYPSMIRILENQVKGESKTVIG